MDERNATGAAEIVVTATCRHAGGVDVQTHWSSAGRVIVTRATDGVVSHRLTVDLDTTTGDVVVAAGADVAAAGASSVAPTRGISPYGVVIETSDLGEGVRVERRFDDDARLREVVLRSPLGVHRVLRWPDGSGSHTWQVAAHEGRCRRDAAGVAVDGESSLDAAAVDVHTASPATAGGGRGT